MYQNICRLANKPFKFLFPTNVFVIYLLDGTANVSTATYIEHDTSILNNDTQEKGNLFFLNFPILK